MSFNSTLNNNGFTLPTFTNVKPTVGISDITPTTETAMATAPDVGGLGTTDTSGNDVVNKNNVENFIEHILNSDKLEELRVEEHAAEEPTREGYKVEEFKGPEDEVVKPNMLTNNINDDLTQLIDQTTLKRGIKDEVGSKELLKDALIGEKDEENTEVFKDNMSNPLLDNVDTKKISDESKKKQNDTFENEHVDDDVKDELKDKPRVNSNNKLEDFKTNTTKLTEIIEPMEPTGREISKASTSIDLFEDFLKTSRQRTHQMEMLENTKLETLKGKGKLLNDQSESEEDSSDESGNDVINEKELLRENTPDVISTPLVDELIKDNHEDKTTIVSSNEKNESSNSITFNNIPQPTINRDLDTGLEIFKTSRNNSIRDIPNPPSNLRKQQAFDFQIFLTKFKSSECEPIHKYLRSFLIQFNQRIWTLNEEIKLLREFQEFLYNKLIELKPFNEEDSDNIKEGLEKLIMTRIYKCVFSPLISFIKLTDTHKRDKLMDKKYITNCQLYNWIDFKHLDLNIVNTEKDNNFIILAIKELNKINEYKSPRDKIVCILNSCKIIFGLIRNEETQEENADSFVPLLIYVLIKAKVKDLYSNLQYIERFRNSEFLIGETSYYVSTMQLACNFIINISKDQLTIEDEDYKRLMGDSRLHYRQVTHQQQQSQQQSQQQLHNSHKSEDTPSQVLTKSAEMVKQSLSQSLSSFLQTFSPDDQPSEQPLLNEPHTTPSNPPLQPSPHQLAHQLAQATAESLAEESVLAQERETQNQLCDMFPQIDRDVVADVCAGVAHSDGEVDVARAVNALLALIER